MNLQVPVACAPTGAVEPDGAAAGEYRGQGLRLQTPEGRVLLDAVSGTFNLALGYNHPVVQGAVRRQLDRAAHVSSRFVAEAATDLGARLLAAAPASMGAAWIRDVTGSTAVECAVKVAQKVTGRSEVISLFHSHHGQTAFATGLSGNAFRREAFPANGAAPSLKVPAPYCRRCFYRAEHPGCGLLCATRIEDFIAYASSGRVAALLVEPVQGNGGNIVPPDGYFAALRAVCDRHGILLIADEVQTGIGRTGRMFAAQTFGFEPDLIVLAKGLGGIGLPIGAVLMRPELAVLEDHEHSFTSGGNLLAIAAARATLEVVGGPGFLAEVRRRGAQLGRGLHALAAGRPMIADVRGVGLMWGVELAGPDGEPSPQMARRAVEIALERHDLVLRSSRYGRGGVVKVRPALIATADDVAEILARLAATLDQLAEEAGLA